MPSAGGTGPCAHHSLRGAWGQHVLGPLLEERLGFLKH